VLRYEHVYLRGLADFLTVLDNQRSLRGTGPACSKRANARRESDRATRPSVVN